MKSWFSRVWLSSRSRRFAASLAVALCASIVCAPASAGIHHFLALIDGSQEVPSNLSPTIGQGSFVLDDVSGRVDYFITYGLTLNTETAAHIHGPAPAGVPASPIVPLSLGPAKIGFYVLVGTDITDMIAGLHYVNVHTSAYLPGEIRGQILETNVTVEPGVGFCFGDGSTTPPCPCANYGARGHGCSNSSFVGGAFLTASGTTAGNDAVLRVSAVTGNLIIYFRGRTYAAPLVFGDGLRCIDPVVRIGAKPVFLGLSSLPYPGDVLTLSQYSATIPGSGVIAVYSGYYRNAVAAFCPQATFNAPNSYLITW